MIINSKQAEKKWQIILSRELKKEMEKAPSIVSSHDLSHIERVWNNVKKISKRISLDWEIVIAAVYLHDIGRHYPEGAREHGPISAPYARQVLKRIQFPQNKIEPATLAIKYHDPTFPSSTRPQIEAKILFDADKIDAFGAIGVSRYLIFNNLRNFSLEETIDYALKSIPKKFKLMELKSSKKIAKPQFKYAVDFFKKLKKELEINIT